MKNKIYSKLIILLALVLCLAACDGAVHLPNAQIVFVNVTFNANGGSGEMDFQAVVQNKATNLLANTFTRVGYTFDGWNTKADGSGTSYTNEQSVSFGENVTLYAKWKANKYTITYIIESDEHINDVSYPVDYECGIGATLPTNVTKDKGGTSYGYHFEGWYIPGTTTKVDHITSEDSGNKTFDAVFIENK